MQLTVRKNEKIPSIAILEKGFRPFFLLCALFAAVWIPLWSYRFSVGWSSDWIPSYWHAHEMVYGFFVAMIAGFLLTAVENWTGKPVVGRVGLLALVLLWIAGRIAYVSGELSLLRCAIENLFLISLFAVLARSIIRARSKRNYKILAVVGLFCALDILFSYAVLYVSDQTLARSVAVGSVYVVMLLVLIIGGRVFPFFTGRRLGVETKNIRLIEIILPICVLVLVFSRFLPVWFNPSDSLILVADGLSVVTGVLIFVRMRHWAVVGAMRVPMLAVLHVGHILLGIGLIFSGIQGLLGIVNGESLGLHLIIIGGLSMVGIGMITRVSLGHTGRTIEAGRWIVVSFWAVFAACIVRAILPIFFFDSYVRFVEIGSFFWSLGFAIYATIFTPILMSARPDGRAG